MGLNMSKPREVAIHNALIKLDKIIEPNLTHGPGDRTVSWAMLKRTIPCSSDFFAAIRCFPDE